MKGSGRLNARVVVELLLLLCVFCVLWFDWELQIARHLCILRT